MEESTVTMKLLIDTKAKRVLFAEAGKDCVDFLFYFLSLPVATVIRLLKGSEMDGSLPNLYQSLEKLNSDYIQPNQKKDSYLMPMPPVSGSSAPLLGMTNAPMPQKEYYGCSYCSNNNFSDVSGVSCPSCRRQMSAKMNYVDPPSVQVAAAEGGLVKGVVNYMVMDNLEVKPMSTISSLTLLNKFNVKDISSLEEKVVNLGMTEAITLLKTSLHSQKVLTEVYGASPDVIVHLHSGAAFF